MIFVTRFCMSLARRYIHIPPRLNMQSRLDVYAFSYRACGNDFLVVGSLSAVQVEDDVVCHKRHAKHLYTQIECQTRLDMCALGPTCMPQCTATTTSEAVLMPTASAPEAIQ